MAKLWADFTEFCLRFLRCAYVSFENGFRRSPINADLALFGLLGTPQKGPFVIHSKEGVGVFRKVGEI